MKINKNIFSSLLFSLILIFFTGCTNYDPWLKKGFTQNEADQWIELKIQPSEAYNFNDGGITPSESLKWKASGFNAKDAS